jgi:uncharacterized protein
MILRTLALLTFALVLPLQSAAQLPAPPPQTGPVLIPPAPAGTVPWDLLQKAQTVQRPDKKFGPLFTSEIRALDKRDVKLFGFMMPLEQSRKQKRFLLAAYPPHCAFCLPSGPESLVEVIADTPVEFTFDPIVVGGRLSVLDDDVVFYRLTNAAAVQP